MIHAIAQANHQQRGFHVFVALPAVEIRQRKWQLNVLICRQNGDQVIELKDEADVIRTPPR